MRDVEVKNGKRVGLVCSLLWPKHGTKQPKLVTCLGKTASGASSPCPRHAVDASLSLELVTTVSSIHNAVITLYTLPDRLSQNLIPIADMPPKKKRRTDTPQSSPSAAEPVTPDLASWPGWCEIESEPVRHRLLP